MKTLFLTLFMGCAAAVVSLGSCGTGEIQGDPNCSPTTCSAQGMSCGTTSDGCGKILECGSCQWPESCGGGGVPNVCGVLPLCGNGRRDPGESCDGNCPVDCNDNEACTADALGGSAALCTAVCVHEAVTACNGGDGCCPAGCSVAADGDCPTTADLADMIVTNVSMNPAAPAPGEATTFNATVKNQGATATPAGVINGVAFSVDGAVVTWSDDHTTSIPAGQSVTVTANGGPAGSATWTATAGAHTLDAWVNDAARYPESDTTNNHLRLTFAVSNTGKTVDLGILGDASMEETELQGMRYFYLDKSYYPGHPWPEWLKTKQIIWQSTYTEDPWGYYQAKAIHRKGLTNVDFMKWKFDLATANKDNFTYGAFLLAEEMYNPRTLVGGQWAAWTVNYVDWVIDGTATLGGETLEALKPWYVRTKGAWDQAWWEGLKASNNPNDATIIAFTNEYYFKLHKAWVAHMHSLGKKAAIIGLAFANPGWKKNAAYLYGNSEIANWVLANYDFIMHYTYPMCMPPAVPCQTGTYRDRPFEDYVLESELQELRSAVKGKLAWNLTTLFGDGYGSSDKGIQFAEFERVLPYVDVITALSVADAVTWTIPMAPRLLEFCSATNSCDAAAP